MKTFFHASSSQWSSPGNATSNRGASLEGPKSTPDRGRGRVRCSSSMSARSGRSCHDSLHKSMSRRSPWSAGERCRTSTSHGTCQSGTRCSWANSRCAKVSHVRGLHGRLRRRRRAVGDSFSSMTYRSTTQAVSACATVRSSSERASGVEQPVELRAVRSPQQPVGPASLLGEVADPFGVTEGLLEVRDLLGDGGWTVADELGDTATMSESSPRGEFCPALQTMDQRQVGRAVDRVVHRTEAEPPPLAAVGIMREDESSSLAAKGACQVLHDDVAVAVADEGDRKG